MQGFWHQNWWNNEIGLPLVMGKSCLLMQTSSLFATKALAGCVHVLARSTFKWEGSGANGLGQAQASEIFHYG
jgi:hypothetical protein